MMWKDEGYMASGEKLVSPSLKAFSIASKALRPKRLVMHLECSMMRLERSLMHLRVFSHVSNVSRVFNKRSVKGRCSVNGMFTTHVSKQSASVGKWIS